MQSHIHHVALRHGAGIEPTVEVFGGGDGLS